ncbi:MAG: glycoside hydrolase family 15 protein [Acidiferrobacteraceae bacterium]
MSTIVPITPPSPEDPPPDRSAEPSGRAPMPWADIPTWTSAKKDAIGGSLGTSRLWFTVAQGIITEVYYPRIDIPQLKDLGFIVADGRGFWQELKTLGTYDLEPQAEGVPALTVRHRHPRFEFTLRICPDPDRDVLLMEFALQGDAALTPYVLCAPRLGGDAARNLAYTGVWNGSPLLWAEQAPFGLALACLGSGGLAGFGMRSVGGVGTSDGWQDFQRHGRMTWSYAEAGPGSVAMMAALPTEGVLALALGSSKEAAAALATASLTDGFTRAWRCHGEMWRGWQERWHWPASLTDRISGRAAALLATSAMVLKVHEDRTFPGALVASLSIPWGEASESRGGYHLVWTRDLVESTQALLAFGALPEARAVLAYLCATQQADGHWLQNQWVDGKPFWQGVQLDETAFPVLLAAALRSAGALEGMAVDNMIRRALAFLIREGPVTGQDRWEEDAGINTFTLAVVLAALVDGSAFLEDRARACALMVADYWNSRLEDWTWAEGTSLADSLGVPGYYLRIAPGEVLSDPSAKALPLFIKNRAHDPNWTASAQIATDFLQLCRYGLRDPHDPRIASTITAVDKLLRTDTPSGPVWHRYNGDGYGEHVDGKPFDGTGRGRGWPLFTGERGHYALIAGLDPLPYLETMAAMTGRGGLLPEQVWDSAPIPEKDLYPGRPSGSAMPLVWAHAEFIKLCLSIAAGEPVDRPKATWERYRGSRPDPAFVLWRPGQAVRTVARGKEVRVLVDAPARVHWGRDGWQQITDTPTADWDLAHVAVLPTRTLPPGTRINLTLYWLREQRWLGKDFEIEIVEK